MINLYNPTAELLEKGYALLLIVLPALYDAFCLFVPVNIFQALTADLLQTAMAQSVAHFVLTYAYSLTAFFIVLLPCLGIAMFLFAKAQRDQQKKRSLLDVCRRGPRG